MRKSGILMHISSLPSRYGIGKLGKHAFDFVDFLEECGMSCWQVLPLNPTSFGDSPYQSFSVFAGNPYFIDFETMNSEGLIKKSDYDEIKWQDNERQVNYSKLYGNVYKIMKKAYNSFRKDYTPKFEAFEADNALWLDDYALYMALKTKNNGKPWYEWDKKLAIRDETAIESAKKELEGDIEMFKFIQFVFHKQWKVLKAYANAKGIEIIGDTPIYAAYDSADVWANPSLFALDKKLVPTEVAGCPPDDYSPTGQLWGNPVYNWDEHKKQGYSWWIERLRHASVIYDTVRIDHFRGFESYYTIPFGSKTAEKGKWKKGPDIELFKAAEEKLGKLNVIAEDLGFITPEVRTLLDKTGFPGMKVLQFGFDSPASEHLPHNFKTHNCVAYTGTHDNDTLKGWAYSLEEKELSFCKKYLDINKKRDIPAYMLRCAWSSVADIAIAQIQDFFELDSSARMNTPSTIGTNWMFRAKNEDFTPKLIKRIVKLNKLYNRYVQKKTEPETEEKPQAKKETKSTAKTVK